MGFWVIVGVIILAPVVWADRICVRNSDGKIIEYQSQATAGTLIRNAKAAGYNDTQVTERVVTTEEYAALKFTQDAPQRDAKAAKVQKQKDQAEQIRGKLNLSAKEFDDLKEALGLSP